MLSKHLASAHQQNDDRQDGPTEQRQPQANQVPLPERTCLLDLVDPVHRLQQRGAAARGEPQHAEHGQPDQALLAAEDSFELLANGVGGALRHAVRKQVQNLVRRVLDVEAAFERAANARQEHEEREQLQERAVGDFGCQASYVVGSC